MTIWRLPAFQYGSKTRISTMGTITSQSWEHLSYFDLDRRGPLGGWGGNDNNNDNDADPPCPILPLRAPPQQPNISPMLLMTKTGTNTRMPPLPLPLPLTLTTRVGRRSGQGRRLPPYHRDLWRSPHRITPALLCLLVQIARGAARTDKHAPAWFPIPCDKEGIC